MILSVLMAVYGRESPDFLRECLASLATQTRLADEIVIVQDGPLTRSLEETIASFQSRLPILIVKLPVNVGLGAALRLGLSRCQGRFVARMDSDDLSRPWRFEKQLDFLESHPGVDVVGSAIAEFERDCSAPRFIRSLPADGNELLRFSKMRNPLNHMTVMFRRKAVLAAGSYQSCKGFEDYHLWAKMLLRGSSLHNLADILVLARCGNGMLNRRGGFAYFMEEINAQRMLAAMRFLNDFQFARNVMMRGPVRLVPNIMRSLFYRLFLRKATVIHLSHAELPCAFKQS
jgi:glycosyltransferase involved in cell wall biosynthesis